MKIGLFDSGIGGATILKQVRKISPNEDYLYYSDSINNPYGDKTPEEITKFSKAASDYLLAHGAKMIIIACNTASAAAAKELRRLYRVPIIATEPAYKARLAGKSLLMATEGTINSEKFHNLISRYNNPNIIVLDCKGLAERIENEDGVQDYLDAKLRPYRGAIQNVILGCTHYPLVKPEIETALGGAKINFIDSATGVANQTEAVRRALCGGLPAGSGQVDFFDSSGDDLKRQRFFKILLSE